MSASALRAHRVRLLTAAGVALATALVAPVLSQSVTARADAANGLPDTVLVTTAADGTPANGEADRPEISGDGRYVTFDSTATNLTPGITTDQRRVYRKDLQTGAIIPLAVNQAGVPTNAFCSFSWPSDDGNIISFVTDATDLTAIPATQRGVYVRDVNAGTTEMISIGINGKAANGASSRPMMSSTGRFVAFSSYASNLTPTGNPGGQEQVYVRDRLNQTTTLVSVASAGGVGNNRSYRGMISADGRYVAFASASTNLTTEASQPNNEAIYLRDLVNNTTTRITLRNGVPAPLGGSRPYLSPDGRYVIFNSYDPLVAGDTSSKSDVFLYDTTTGTTERESVSPTGADGNNDSLRGFISDNGRYTLFNSFATNLVGNDTNSNGDVFIRDRTTGTTTLLSLNYAGGGATGQSYRPVMSDDGSVVAYLSEARNLVPNDTTSTWQVYVMHPSSVMGSTPDTTPPVSTVTYPTANAVNVGRTVNFTGTITDDRGVDRAFVQIRRATDGFWMRPDGSFASGAYRIPVVLDNRFGTSSGWTYSATLDPGSYGVQPGGFDVAGNGYTSAPLVSFKVSDTAPDTTAPGIVVGSPSPNQTLTTNDLTLSGTASDDVGVKSVFVEIRDNSTNQWLQPDGTYGASAKHLAATLDTTVTPNAWTFSVHLPDGSYGFDAGSLDAAGNASPKPFTNFKINTQPVDSTPAAATITSPTADQVLTGSPTVLTGSATDNVGVTTVYVQIQDRTSGLWLHTDGTWAQGAQRLTTTLSVPGGQATDWSYSAPLPAAKYFFNVTAFDAPKNAPVVPSAKFSVASTG